MIPIPLPRNARHIVTILLLSAFAASAPRLLAQQARPCSRADLRPRVDGLDGGAGHAAWAFEVTNISRKPCELDLVPKVAFLDVHGKRLAYSFCMDCSDYLFKKSPHLSESPVLSPGASAFFLVGGEEAGYGSCPTALALEMTSADGSRIRFPEPTRQGFWLCDKADVSGWRLGRYSDDLCFTCN